MFLASLSIKRPIMVSMGLVVFLLFGVIGYLGLPLNMMPDVTIPIVTVQTIYPGAGPQEMEILVTKKIEDAVSTISKIDLLRSFSLEGVSIIMIRFDLDKDQDIASQEVRDKVSAIVNELPEDAKAPVIEKFDISSFPVMDIVFTGPVDMRELYNLADKKLKDRFSQIEGVGKVSIVGGEQREIRVEFDNRVVFQNMISLQQMARILATQNMNIPGGHFLNSGQELSVRFKGEYPDVETIRQMEVYTAFGIKRLGQLAHVKDAGAEIRERTTYFNNQENIRENKAVKISLIKSVDGNTVDLATAAKNEIPLMEADLPKGCKLSVVQDGSVYIQSSVEDTLGNIILGVIFTGLVLLFFLHDLRSTIIVATAMPFSIISTFLFLQLFDFSLNIMSLMGLSTAVGILVTNSVVVLENIFRHKGMGHNRREAADKGTAEIAVAVIASTLTNIVVFLPIAMMTSMVGQFFKEFALTVTFATIFSIIASFTVTPMLASLILPERDTKKHPLGERLEALFHKWEIWYQNSLKWMLKSKGVSWITITTAFGTFFLVFFFIGSQIGFEFMPLLDEGDIRMEVELPQSYNLNETAALIASIENRLEEHEEVKHILTTLGSMSELDKGANLAQIAVKLVNVDEREMSSAVMADRFIKELSDIPNAMIRIGAVSNVGRGDAPITFYLLGQDIEQLEKYKAQVLDSIRTVPGLVNLNTSSRSGKPEFSLTPDRLKMANAGISVIELSMTLRGAIEGIVATKYRESGDEYDIRIKMTDESIDSPEKIGNITVITQTGRYRLSQLADIELTEGYSKILHKDKYKSIEFYGYTAPGVPLGDVTSEITRRIENIDFKYGYKVDWGGTAKMMNEFLIDILSVFIIAMLLTYMLLAATLESFTQPAMILSTIPLAFIGVFLALFVTGATLNIISMLAIVMLVGIVVNNAILLLDYTNQLYRKGKNSRDALIEACPTKLKPIVMATVAIILGMLPMAMGIGSAGVEFRQPMGIVSIGGLIVSAIMTLYVIPAFYFVFTRAEKKDR